MSQGAACATFSPVCARPCGEVESCAGFSFGSRMALRLGCALQTPAPRRVIAVGFPTQRQDFDFLSRCGVPKYFVQSSEDEHGPAWELEAAFAEFAEPKHLEFIEAGDHFFEGGLDELEAAITAIPTAERAQLQKS